MDVVIIYPRFEENVDKNFRFYDGPNFLFKTPKGYLERDGTLNKVILDVCRFPVLWVYDTISDEAFDKINPEDANDSEKFISRTLQILSDDGQYVDIPIKFGDYVKFNNLIFLVGPYGILRYEDGFTPTLSPEKYTLDQHFYLIIGHEYDFQKDQISFENLYREGINIPKYLPTPALFYTEEYSMRIDEDKEIVTRSPPFPGGSKYIWLSYNVDDFDDFMNNIVPEKYHNIISPGDYFSIIDVNGKIFTSYVFNLENIKRLYSFDPETLALGRLSEKTIKYKIIPLKVSPKKPISPKKVQFTKAQREEFIKSLKYDNRLQIDGNRAYHLRGTVTELKTGKNMVVVVPITPILKEGGIDVLVAKMRKVVLMERVEKIVKDGKYTLSDIEERPYKNLPFIQYMDV